jgi:FkbH-like protein
MKIAILSNMNLDILKEQMSLEFQVYSPAGYGAWVQELVNPDSLLYQFDPTAVFVILDAEELVRNKENIPEQLQQLGKYGQFIETALKGSPSFKMFVSNLDLPVADIHDINELNTERTVESGWLKIMEELNQYENFYVFDLKRLVEEKGRNVLYSRKLWYLSGMKLSMKGMSILQKEMEVLLKAVRGNRKKCLALDLDNTLWGGVIGEDGLDGIELEEFKEGARFKDFQKRIREMKERGVILTVVSKNIWKDVEEVFEKHPHMVLKQEDIVSFKVNWKPKYQNLEELSEELNIGLDSFVFIDDNPIERGGIQHQLPQVVVPDFPSDTSLLERFIRGIHRDYFLGLHSTEEDKRKTELYQQIIRKDEALRSTASFEDFLESLETRIKIWKIKEEDIPRVSQLTMKTNQFNLTTRRYSEKDIRSFCESKDYELYVASVEDKFGDNGKVVVVILERKDNHIVELDTFLMSCRVMGKFIEDHILQFIENRLKEGGYKEFRTFYRKTNRNEPVSNLFDRLKYQVNQSDETHKEYSKSLNKKNKRKQYGKLMEL